METKPTSTKTKVSTAVKVALMLIGAVIVVFGTLKIYGYYAKGGARTGVEFTTEIGGDKKSDTNSSESPKETEGNTNTTNTNTNANTNSNTNSDPGTE
ncbi:MAG TPA: hypothetical protein DEG44_00395 [Candidatus Kerfeldbacteria bacterium]|nr:hypothetical protein [Candidatus Kerfeldbacteria bacterium]